MSGARSFLDDALALAARGWHVFPLAPRKKLPLVSRDRGGRGCLDASANVEQIRSWWSRCPQANIGIRTGAESRMWAVDVDIANGKAGDATLAGLELRHGTMPDTVEAITGSGGRHALFGWVPELDGAIWNALGDGLDVRGTNQYIVAPGSVHPNGRTYEWDAACHPDDVAIAKPPEWLVALLVGRRSRRQRHTHAAAVDPRSFVLGAAFKKAGWLGAEIRPGVFAVVCPNEHEHTAGEWFDSSTVIFAPRPGSKRGTFFCSHEHCRGRLY